MPVLSTGRLAARHLRRVHVCEVREFRRFRHSWRTCWGIIPLGKFHHMYWSMCEKEVRGRPKICTIILHGECLIKISWRAQDLFTNLLISAGAWPIIHRHWTWRYIVVFGTCVRLLAGTLLTKNNGMNHTCRHLRSGDDGDRQRRVDTEYQDICHKKLV